MRKLNMTNEDAIYTLDRLRHIEAKWPGTEDTLKAIEMAIRAIRAVSSNEPLTLDQLRRMDGKPVWVQTPGIEKYGRWAIVAGVNIEDNALYCQGDYTCRDYGKMWIAYAYPPAHIDREAWKPCFKCESKCYYCMFNGSDRCRKCKDYNQYKPMRKFCSECGRPLTEEAWAELEKRLRG